MSGAAGKGDSPRPINLTTYRSNYESINWKSKRVKRQVDFISKVIRKACKGYVFDKQKG